MSLQTLLENVASVEDGATLDLQLPPGKDEIKVQVSITGAATVELWAAIHTDIPLVKIQEINSSGIYPLTSLTRLQARVTAISSGTVHAVVRTR